MQTEDCEGWRVGSRPSSIRHWGSFSHFLFPAPLTSAFTSDMDFLFPLLDTAPSQDTAEWRKQLQSGGYVWSLGTSLWKGRQRLHTGCVLHCASEVGGQSGFAWDAALTPFAPSGHRTKCALRESCFVYPRCGTALQPPRCARCEDGGGGVSQRGRK